ncbi:MULTISPECIES: hypothetical protein [unclassified Streptomyces]|uniref:hypothetical protein n=1 Tax=unclassified Streptomyces TaxID=2593676 RepID=UPI000DBA2EBA|nr:MULTISPECIES: hypothetical protein [unclassified Streptomyces]MYT68424.1 hypothetical protein [Streptomyces sp. SID8367]RAJ86097.1 hypothetical protein K377_02939 [Streptomyces sp. PsTaAH-137]
MSPDQDAAQAPEKEPGPAKEPRNPKDDKLDAAQDAQLADDELPESAGAASRTYRATRTAFDLRDSSTYVGADQVGTINFYGSGPGGAARLVAGPVTDDELRRLRDTFCTPDGYADLKRRLAADHLLVLHGRAGTGRMFTALSLLDDVTRGKVSRLDTATELDRLEGEHIEEGRGYALERATASSGVQLDHLRHQLTERGAFAVLLRAPDPGVPAPPPDRHHAAHTPPNPLGVLEQCLLAALGDRTPLGRRLAGAEATHSALGLGTLLPAEAARLADRITEHVDGQLTEAQLSAACRGFATAQATEWFAGGLASESLPRLREAAFRIALAVLGGASVSAVTEAAEQLAWEFAVTTDPGSAPGRLVFNDGLDARLAAARAVTEPGTESLGDAEVPVRTVRFAGDRLAGAVLEHLWEHRPGARGPVLRWLASLCDDPRAQVWVRAAVATGVLCRLDCADTVQELVQPMAASKRWRQRQFAATALDLAVTAPEIGPAVGSLVRSWARRGSAGLRRTAATVLGRGHATASLAESLDLLAAIGTWKEDGSDGEAGLRQDAADCVAQLAGTTTDTLPTRRVRSWLAHPRIEEQNLGLQSTLSLAQTPAAHVWDPVPGVAGLGDAPLLIALAVDNEEHAPALADLLWTALNTSRSYEAALGIVEGWLTASQGQPWAGHLARFLGLSVHTDDDRKRLLSLLTELTQDQYTPLAEDHARLLRHAVQGEGAR